MNAHQLTILRREGLVAYATVIGKPIDEAYEIARKELEGSFKMTQVYQDLVDEETEFKASWKRANAGWWKNYLGFALVMIMIGGGVLFVAHTLKTTAQFTGKVLPKLVGAEVVNEIDATHVPPLKKHKKR